jgi:hypothetical protein
VDRDCCDLCGPGSGRVGKVGAEKAVVTVSHWGHVVTTLVVVPAAEATEVATTAVCERITLGTSHVGKSGLRAP